MSRALSPGETKAVTSVIYDLRENGMSNIVRQSIERGAARETLLPGPLPPEFTVQDVSPVVLAASQTRIFAWTYPPAGEAAREIAAPDSGTPWLCYSKDGRTVYLLTLLLSNIARTASWRKVAVVRIGRRCPVSDYCGAAKS